MNEKFCVLIKISLKFVPKSPIDINRASVNRAIIWTYAGPIHWRIYAALGGDELTARAWAQPSPWSNALMTFLCVLLFLSSLLVGTGWHGWYDLFIVHEHWSSQDSCGQHGAHLGPPGPRWAPRWPHEFCYQCQWSNNKHNVNATKLAPFCTWHLWITFLDRKSPYSNPNLIKFVPNGQVINKPALVQIMGCRLFGTILAQIYITQPRWHKLIRICRDILHWYTLHYWNWIGQNKP